ncbi:asparagine synthase (glutamine-hydrolyzing) [Inmirania thermothiophila]|uniref:asparagine synthase (glutamine-hydrolyzing) n=1 Tax=Inmirania thermothiophila TaxID=1750597 RepID=A0A3N1XST0_9GAMM|nr:asparagine synthase (glutamine-hydrolyzing) [Inmirania thermothiophila]ROR29704.1 asparagine synthase (glutamine-hydrolysing) [Inmirania thermothiophila]
MCGIAGWFATGRREGAAAILERMADRLAHRGPDGRGVWSDAHAGLAHTRLAVIDPEGGAQPLWDAEGRAVIVFNGEIYNHEALRRALVREGASFRTRSDTEVVLQLFLRRGVEGLARLRGMYALALWEPAARRGWLARDPLGIKPLFVQEAADTLRFGSEAKAILADPGAGSPRLDEAALHLLLNLRYPAGETTLFRGIRQVPPGTVLEWRDGRVRRHAIPEAAAGDAPLMEAIRDSVQAHLVADVAVGAYLSGGIDSATVVALSGRPLPTFTLDVGDDPREAEHAARTAELLGVPNRREALRLDLAEELPRLVWHLEAPKINALQSALVARCAAGAVKVALSGLGGDELFMGYRIHGLIARAQALARLAPPPLAAPAGAIAAAAARTLGRAEWSEPERAALAVAALGDWPRVYGLLRNLWDDPRRRRRIYGPRMLDAELPDAWRWLAAHWPEAPTPLAQTERFEWRHKMVNDLLWNEDRVSMACGIEVRVPFVDGPLAARVRRLTPEARMPRGRLKGLLREELRSVLPREVLERPKSGFQLDAPSFFAERLAPLARDWLSPERIRRHGLFNPDWIARTMRLPPQRRHRWHFFMLYLMLLTHLWIEVFEQGR